MTHATIIEIDEVETNILIDFEMYFGQPEINKITNIETGDALGLEISDNTFNDLMEYVADYNAEKSYTRFNYDY